MRLPRFLHQACVFVAALRIAHEIRSLPALSLSEAFDFAQSRVWYGGDRFRANQRKAEIMRLLELLEFERPRTVVEIGMDRGGTLFLWSRVAADDALLVTVEREPVHGRLGRFSPFAFVRASFAQKAQRIVFVDRASSADPTTLGRVKAALGARSIDFLFIDGDHSYEAVKRDYELYGPLVRPGGLIALHDVARSAAPGTEGAARFWRELTEGAGQFSEFVDGDVAGYGIGLSRISQDVGPRAVESG